MGFIGDIFAGSKGAGWTAGAAPITTADDISARNNAAYNATGAVSADQAALAHALLAQSQGTGPNPAAAALQNATNQNQAMTAGNIASIKGINPALAARSAANAGAQMQQQSAGQRAQLGAQQQLGAQNQLGALYGQQQNQNLAQQGMELNALNDINKANIANSAQQNGAQSGIANTLAGGQQAITGGLIKSFTSAPQMAEGGMVPHFGFGGGLGLGNMDVSSNPMPSVSTGQGALGTGNMDVSSNPAPVSGGPTLGVDTTLPTPSFGNYMSGLGAKDSGEASSSAPVSSGVSNNPGAQALFEAFDMSNRTKGMGKMAMMFIAKGGQVGDGLKGGGKVPGQASVKGDSYANDTIDAKLSPQEIVLPRSVTMSDDPVGNAAKFVQAILSKNRMKK